MPSSTQRKGADAEQRAEEYLVECGYRIVARNFRTRFGEIDRVAVEKGFLVFVEIRSRVCPRYGFPGETVGYNKQIRLIRAAKLYLKSTGVWPWPPVRFDVLSIVGDTYAPSIELYRNAFQVSEE